MKKGYNYLFGFLLLFISNYSFSQQITIKELQSIYYEDNVSSIDYLLAKKKFTLNSAKDIKNDGVTYKFLEWSKIINGNKFSVSKYESKNWMKSITVNYTFHNDVSLYLRLKEELKNIGFKNIKIENTTENTINYTYTNGLNNVIITQYNPQISSEENWYHVTIMSK